MQAVEKEEVEGSRKWIRSAVNQHSKLFGEKIREALDLESHTAIEWFSPLASETYKEYEIGTFLEKLKIPLPKRRLADFWPDRGPQWDALGKTDDGQILLVEAKAHVSEIVSPGTGASDQSRRRIEQSLNETKKFMDVDQSIPWSGRLYQYANRLAYLYFLRQVNEIPAHLVFVYFFGDKEMHGPETEEEWKAAICVAEEVLGIGRRHPLSKYVHEVFVHVREMGNAQA